MANELTGKVAIVTGGTMGIGAAIAEVFAQEGATIVIAGRDVDMGLAMEAKLGPAVRFKRADVGLREEIEALIDYTVSEFGHVDVMVNNAAITGKFHNRFLDDDLADFEEVMRIDLAGVMHGSQLAARQMVKQGGGSIVNLTSIAALVPGYSILTYRAAKAGVINFTKSLAVDLGEYGIRVNAIAPGHIPTRLSDFNSDELNAEKRAELGQILDRIYSADQPLARKGSPHDLANAVLFFASERSVFVTGQVIAVDGGVTAGSAFNQNALLTEARARFLLNVGC